jgi:hypothetical protein
LLFHQPHEIIAAHRLEDVRPALNRLRDGVARGHHAAGFLAYEAGFALEPRLADHYRGPGDLPLLWFGLFDAPSTITLPSLAANRIGTVERSLIPTVFEDSYLQHVSEILALIEAGIAIRSISRSKP